ncbi:Enamine deaminase RidA, house cleaning of reactive enamine intermediates, YjgF/YER057c/UK114 family [Devosia psychrophila]|uniref:Enamine deaminase RidA, house cleaning of reactive enamine intermediates, YjgF/YER057c/UK114 family n=2 Tax=Devosia psychrophila TaxID=728005 RepID=A0A1I1LMB7_9HYPH|nr:Enamine deaminase RidA, house cleaning of reactive enamine intermediates, YjgF/YER057c/UK114 family [Devosia psychrophila]
MGIKQKCLLCVQQMSIWARQGTGLPLAFPLTQNFQMAIPLNPSHIHPPFAHYSHGVLVPAGQRLVFCSGQLGIAADKIVPPDCAEQARICFDNIAAILAEAGMGLGNIVRINAYVTGREHLAAYMAIRNALFAEPYPASTLMLVSGFARPEFVVEIEAIAAGPA